MSITSDHVGRSYPPTRPYEVSAAKIAEYAAALGETGAAEAAPPTFAVVVASAAWQQLFDDRDLGLALNRIVHADQRFTFDRLLQPGDRVQAILTIDQVRVRAGTELISATTRIEATVEGDEPELVCTAQATFVHSREVAA
ncbi:MAG: FAS1-like dehydratase domain-containing protein [Propionibacteriaceae bacterium]